VKHGNQPQKFIQEKAKKLNLREEVYVDAVRVNAKGAFDKGSAWVFVKVVF
jgi:hypothetical protein